MTSHRSVNASPTTVIGTKNPSAGSLLYMMPQMVSRPVSRNEK
jgi:hypothetical protein